VQTTEIVPGMSTDIAPFPPEPGLHLPVPHQPRRRARALVVTVVILLLAGAGAVGAWRFTDRPAPAPAPKAVTTEPITRETLTEEVVVTGRLNYGATTPVAVTTPGMVTWLPPVGAPVRRGQALARVDDQPVVLLYGDMPLYRPLTVGTKGRDVEQFEENLQKLGYVGFTADEEYTTSTADAVKRWQKWMEVPVTGAVGLGFVVYVPSAIRVANHLVRPGAAAGGDVLTYTGQRRTILVDLEAGKSAWAKKGVAVRITLPDGATTKGKVSKVENTPSTPAPDATAAPAGETDGVTVTVEVADQDAIRAVDPGRLDVRYTAKERKDVLTVPVAALLALSEGGYGLELVDGTGRRIVPVEVGLFTAARIEVSGEGIEEGVTVAIPE
jgi:peptidoglycan hydrolase-like protein with peptidoglycan-binding domain